MRKCRICGDKFRPSYNTLQATCGKMSCAIAHGKKLQEKARKEESAAFKKKVRDNDRPYHLKKCQEAFNRLVRIRDEKEPCISCQRHHSGQYHAGHYRSVGACPELRFNLENCHKQCAPCNNHKSGNIGEYRINLIKKIGLSHVEYLEGPHDPNKYTIWELKVMTASFKELTKGLLQDAA